MVKILQLLDNASPRNLMSSLQHSGSSSSSSCASDDYDDGESGGTWKVRTNELAVQEIRRDRREAAIENGRLKGRRLFVDEEEESSSPGRSQEFWNQNYNSQVRSSNSEPEEGVLSHGGEREVPVVCCQYCFASYSSPNSVTPPPRKATKVVADDQVKEKSGGVSVRSRWMVVLGWFTIVALIVCAVVITISMPLSTRRCYCVYMRDEYEDILVPT